MSIDNAAFSATFASGMATTIMSFFNANAAGIGAICTMISLLVYAVVSMQKWRVLKNAEIQQRVFKEPTDL